MNEQWRLLLWSSAEAKAFDTIAEGDLIFGQFPHSRQDNNIYLRRPDGEIIPFDGHRRLIDVEVKSSNYEKESELSGDEIRKSVVASIIVDGVKLVEVFGREVIDTLRRVEQAIVTYGEHESNWFSKEAREQMPGRKIWYYNNQPATIKSIIEEQNAIIIETEPGFIPPIRRDGTDDEQYEIDEWEDWKVGGHYEVKDDVLSPHIWWWRK